MFHEEGLGAHFIILLGTPQSFLESQSALKKIGEFNCEPGICVYSTGKSGNTQSANPISSGFPSRASGGPAMKASRCIFWHEV